MFIHIWNCLGSVCVDRTSLSRYAGPARVLYVLLTAFVCIEWLYYSKWHLFEVLRFVTPQQIRSGVDIEDDFCMGMATLWICFRWIEYAPSRVAGHPPTHTKILLAAHTYDAVRAHALPYNHRIDSCATQSGARAHQPTVPLATGLGCAAAAIQRPSLPTAAQKYVHADAGTSRRA
ncbi:hypothetical protein DENSPDRAFT_136953 [Dentipellis sp. KUC8613]|nr:hypothetical protein DENSPDRAFT_136953 [Dentipellis sp. KUC8613]